jgi:hypothetical protein
MAQWWEVGVAANIVGSLIINLGTVILKFHILQKESRGHFKWLAFLLLCVGGVITYASFSLAEQSLLAPLSAVQFVSNLFLGWLILGETITPANMMGTTILCLGLCLAVAVTPKADSAPKVQIYCDKYYFSWNHMLFLASIFFSSIFISSLFYCRSAVFPIWIDPKNEQRLIAELSRPRSSSPSVHVVLAALYVAAGSLIGAQSVVAGKVLTLELADAIVNHDLSRLLNLRPVAVFSMWLVTVLFWIVHLNRALRIFRGAFVITLAQVAWIVATLISSGVVFREFAHMSSGQLDLIGVSGLVLIVGIGFLCPERKSSEMLESSKKIPCLRSTSVTTLPSEDIHRVLTEILQPRRSTAHVLSLYRSETEASEGPEPLLLRLAGLLGREERIPKDFKNRLL